MLLVGGGEHRDRCWYTAAPPPNRPGVPVPSFIAEGISEAEAKDIAARYTVYINKFLGMLGGVVGEDHGIITRHDHGYTCPQHTQQLWRE